MLRIYTVAVTLQLIAALTAADRMPAMAQTVQSQGLTWSVVRGANTVAIDDSGIHIAQRYSQNTADYAIVTTPLQLTSDEQWSISFEFRLGRRASAGSYVYIRSAGQRVLLAGGDAWGRQGPWVYLGDRQLATLINDPAWHEVRLRYRRGVAAVDFDGKEVGSGTVSAMPDSLEVGTRNRSAGQQTEIWVRNVRVNPGTLNRSAPRVRSGSAENSGSAVAPRAPVALIVPEATRPIDIRAVFGATPRAAPPVSPSTDGLLIVTGETSQVTAPMGTPVEFVPSVRRPGFEPVQCYAFVNGELVQRRDAIPGDPLPTFLIDVPDLAIGHVSIVAEDSSEQRMELQRSTFRRAGAASPASAYFKLQDGEVKLVGPPAEPDRAYYVFLENRYIGYLAGRGGTFGVKTRMLPAGQYRFEVITQDTTGLLHLPVESTITILPRYRLSSFAQQGVFHVEWHEHTVPLRVVRRPDTRIVKSRVYVAGLYVGENSGSDFRMEIPLDDVRSGTASIDVVGIAKDGACYPPESVHIQLQNYRLNYQAERGQMGSDLQAKIAELSQVEQEVAYWYTKGINEPAFVTAVAARTVTDVITADAIVLSCSTTYLSSISVPGPVADDFGRCAAALVREAKVHLDIGKLYEALGRPDSARAQFQQVVFEVGAESGVGSLALAELRRP